MAKTTFRITHTKTMRKMSYSGDLKEAIRKAETELKKRAESKEEAHLRWQYQKAKKRIGHIRKEDRRFNRLHPNCKRASGEGRRRNRNRNLK